MDYPPSRSECAIRRQVYTVEVRGTELGSMSYEKIIDVWVCGFMGKLASSLRTVSVIC